MRHQRERYRRLLSAADDVEALLREEQRTPPRTNLALALAFADVAEPETIERFASLSPEAAPPGTPGEFLAFCGVLGRGRLAAEGETWLLEALRRHAHDPRWRIREAAIMALARFGAVDPQALLAAAGAWLQGDVSDRETALMVLSSPDLLAVRSFAEEVLVLLDRMTTALGEPRAELSDSLASALARCWSRAICAAPAAGRRRFEGHLRAPTRVQAFVLDRVLKDGRLVRLDPAWVSAASLSLQGVATGTREGRASGSAPSHRSDEG